ncbi:hypothetical protein OG909_04335 [Streptomyces sp. NBC_01754]|uniref:hypothetical protein n=1 Tax=Streptomyces sp. NBC_01754 TaxID=2975930 RepID=UPI002DDC1576|nr:hypothetical protein [Streptomyces sp. NBC_01754]WSC97057.1 hypothetical protein OG909_04335 [Streptomyces sp. NBC_01754]
MVRAKQPSGRPHLTPLGARRSLLATKDAHEVYARLGFTPLAEPEMWMALQVDRARVPADAVSPS